MNDSDALVLRRLLTLYGVQPLLTRIGQVVRSYADQDRKRWGNEDYRMRGAMSGYYRPSPQLNRRQNRRKVGTCPDLDLIAESRGGEGMRRG